MFYYFIDLFFYFFGLWVILKGEQNASSESEMQQDCRGALSACNVFWGELFEAWSSVIIPDGLVFVSVPPRRWRKA